ncbi:hypothetical protein [Pseudoxanthomonas mexicana]|uniref:hypothetical protein n=1 Tax=Pseudoxanthomonas mexicana TaxID=128785 RepID=UPI00398BA4FD
MNSKREEEVIGRDLNRDPITGTPGSHPLGVGVGGTGGAAAGAVIGAMFGPIGMLVGGAAGALAGAAAGKGVAERIDPTGETEYWRQTYATRPYASKDYDYDRDYAVAYGLGLQARESEPSRRWEEAEGDLAGRWDSTRGQSRLDWESAKPAVRDAWERADNTYRAYDATDRYFAERFDSADYRGDAAFDDYRPAYRYGAQARSRYRDRDWDDELENALRDQWAGSPYSANMPWDRARPAVRDAYASYRSYYDEQPPVDRFGVT